MRIRQGLMWVGFWVIGTVVMAEAPGLPEAEVLAGWGAAEWADAALEQAEFIGDDIDREEVHVNVLMAMCQVPGQRARVERLADESLARIETRVGDPLDADYQLPLVIYAYARIGEMEKAHATLDKIQDAEAIIWGLIQMGWGTTQRGDHEATLGVITEVERLIEILIIGPDSDWNKAEIPMLLWLLDEKVAAEDKAEAIDGKDARAEAWMYLGDLAVDAGDLDAAQRYLDAAKKVMATMPDGGAWQTASLAALTARVGQANEAGAMMIRLGGDSYGMVTVGSAIARASHDAGRSDTAERMLNQIRNLTKTVRLEPGFTEPVDLAFMWWDVAVAAHACGRMDLVMQAWDESNTPLNRGMIAAGIAVEMAWADWLTERRQQ